MALATSNGTNLGATIGLGASPHLKNQNFLCKGFSMLKKTVLVACLAACGSSFAADADFVLVNRTGYAINEVFVSPANKSQWGKDRLGKNQMLHGDSHKFKFGDVKNCVQDIKVVFTDDDSEIEWEDVDLCEITKITLRYNRKTREVSADTE
jgi:hypothetical protein